MSASAPISELLRELRPGRAKGRERYIREASRPWSGEDPGSWPSRLRNPLGEGDVSIVPMRVGVHTFLA